MSNILRRSYKLSRREKLIFFLFFFLLLFYGIEYGYSSVYVDKYLTQRTAVHTAEEILLHSRELTMREAWINSEFQKLEQVQSAQIDSSITENYVLRYLTRSADSPVVVKSVSPRLRFRDGQQVMIVTLDSEGRLDSMLDYVRGILKDLPAEIKTLSISPKADNRGFVLCQLSIEVQCREF